IAQLVRDVRHGRDATRDRRASEFYREHGAQGSGNRRQIAATGHRAEADEGRRVQGFRRCRAHEVRKDRRAAQYQFEQLIVMLKCYSFKPIKWGVLEHLTSQKASWEDHGKTQERFELVAGRWERHPQVKRTDRAPRRREPGRNVVKRHGTEKKYR